MKLCERCGYWLSMFGGRCDRCGNVHPHTYAPAVQGPVIRPTSKPKLVRGDD